MHTFSEYIDTSAIKETINISDGKTAVEAVLNGFRNLLSVEREVLQLSTDTNDEGTNALMSDYIRQQEKLVWMYSAYLK